MPANGHLPDSLVLSSEVIDSGGVYLLDSGADLLLYVDQEAPDQIVQVRRCRPGGGGRGTGALTSGVPGQLRCPDMR
jgi:hypothetical protein